MKTLYDRINHPKLSDLPKSTISELKAKNNWGELTLNAGFDICYFLYGKSIDLILIDETFKK